MSGIQYVPKTVARVTDPSPFMMNLHLEKPIINGKYPKLKTHLTHLTDGTSLLSLSYLKCVQKTYICLTFVQKTY